MFNIVFYLQGGPKKLDIELHMVTLLTDFRKNSL